MRKKYIFGKKLYISVLTMIVVLLTTVATTFAWVGVFANSTFDLFDITIKSSSLEEYGIELSLTGEEDDFSNTIDKTNLKKAILKNWGYNIDFYSDETIDDLFGSLNMHQCTTLPNIENNKIVSLGTFKTMEGTTTKNYFKFDLYVTPTKFYNEGVPTDYLLDCYLQNGLLKGTARTVTLIEPVTYPSSFHNNLVGLPQGIQAIQGNETITTCSVNSQSACRVAFEKYDVVDKGNPSAYSNKQPISTIIYTGDSYDYPTYNSNTNVYEFGGILPDNYNLATMYFNQYEYRLSKNGVKHLSLPNDIYQTRGVNSSTKDVILTSDTNHLIDSSNSNELIPIGKMIKMTVSFWIEGWDADCFNVLNSSPIALEIILGAKNTDE